MNHLSHATLSGIVDVPAAAAAELVDDTQRAAFSEPVCLRRRHSAVHNLVFACDKGYIPCILFINHSHPCLALYFRMRTRLVAAAPEADVDDITLLRFLAADSFDVDLGHARLLQTLEWRASANADALLMHPPPELERYQAIRVRHWIGTDREGQPVMLERLGEFMANAPGEGRPFELDHWIALYAWDLERHFVKMREPVRGFRPTPVRYALDGAILSF